MMNKKWKGPLPLLVVAAVALAGSSGCVPQPGPGSLADGPTVSATGGSPAPPAVSVAPSQKSAQPAAAQSPAPAAKTKATKPSATHPADPPAKPLANPGKPPKTWPKDSRASSEKEKSATDHFVAKTEQMTSPDFGKKDKEPNKALPKPPDYRSVATGAALGELQAQFTEYANNNWKQTGAVVVRGEPKVQDLTVDGVATHRVFVCLDSSALQVIEQDGFVVTPKAKPGTRTALNIYDLQEHDGQLVVVNHLFPEDPNC
ncbi:hypothetical protein [Paeniglutamicibacter psychrophenolicus]|uniref:hypothetical protein n=1 Tax=Paeniglutamicibacter psychrophenolicus TaxID=257454 RepID=UPI0027844BF2|nr:hypothetical protein [Paeniglutamicibacter psychrophenolicus]MDQ0092661.1 hypothetical protein [Paeniglutamicibacter psychrophenolicus]